MKIAFLSLGITLLAVVILIGLVFAGMALFGPIGTGIGGAVWILAGTIVLGIWVDRH